MSVLLGVLLVSGLGASGAAPAREVRVVMGTSAEVQVAGLADPPAALNAAFAALDGVDRRFSLWRDDTELARLNRAGSGLASDELRLVLRQALELAAASGGAFDPTVEPLVRAQGGFDGRPRRLGAAERKRLLARVGAAHVQLDETSGRVRLAPGAALDLGGIAKGYAVDLALSVLRDRGARAGLVDLGGSSVRVFGEPLTLGVRNPLRPDGAPWAEFDVEDAAVGSSGGDQRPDHILDPRTGLPARRVLAATVVAATAIEADGLSTTLFVLGEPGLELVTRRGAAGFVLVRERGRPVIRTTPGFAAAHELRPAPGVRVRQ